MALVAISSDGCGTEGVTGGHWRDYSEPLLPCAGPGGVLTQSRPHSLPEIPQGDKTTNSKYEPIISKSFLSVALAGSGRSKGWTLCFQNFQKFYSLIGFIIPWTTSIMISPGSTFLPGGNSGSLEGVLIFAAALDSLATSERRPHLQMEFPRRIEIPGILNTTVYYKL